MITKIFVGIGILVFVGIVVIMLVESFRFVENIESEHEKEKLG